MSERPEVHGAAQARLVGEPWAQGKRSQHLEPTGAQQPGTVGGGFPLAPAAAAAEKEEEEEEGPAS